MSVNVCVEVRASWVEVVGEVYSIRVPALDFSRARALVRGL